MKLTDKDLKQLEKKGISKDELESQIEIFENGVQKVEVLKAATVNEGIIRFNEQDFDELIDIYDNKNDLEVLKFVPASGAATRMFKALYAFIDEVSLNDEEIKSNLKKKKFEILKPLFERLENLAFYNRALDIAKEKTSNFIDLSNHEKSLLILKYSLKEDGLNLGNLPKGLIPFHDYNDKKLTPFEEHLDESIAYAAKNNEINLHFTIAEGLEQEFQSVFKDYKAKIKNPEEYKFNVDYSHQKPSTDTIAVKPDNTVYRKEDGEMFFRPGGHGALIHNLNELNADLIFIKNIDNVSKKESDKNETSKYKKALGGLLLKLKTELDEYLALLEHKKADAEDLSNIRSFMKDSLNISHPSDNTEKLSQQLNKPLRVCGMVKNDGAPGGGPFWIKDENDRQSLQIVETSQMDLEKEGQKEILDNATHFNPVDIVCSIKNHHGEKYDLLDYVNLERAFIASKSDNGTPIKALERPGLWNGAMEYWHTIFVEVPSSTFNPVKTVVDLLKPAHQES